MNTETPKQSTGRFDNTGNEIFIGDKVLKSWLWFNYQGENRTALQIHTIHAEPSEDGIKFRLGRCHNRWTGPELRVISPEYATFLAIPEDTNFFMEGDEPVIFTDQHFLNLSAEDWEQFKKRYSTRAVLDRLK